MNEIIKSYANELVELDNKMPTYCKIDKNSDSIKFRIYLDNNNAHCFTITKTVDAINVVEFIDGRGTTIETHNNENIQSIITLIATIPFEVFTNNYYIEDEKVHLVSSTTVQPMCFKNMRDEILEVITSKFNPKTNRWSNKKTRITNSVLVALNID